METLIAAGQELLALVGRNWLVAWAAGFIVMTFESSRPRADAGAAEQPSASARIGALAIAALPFLLFLDAFGAFILSKQDTGPIGGTQMLPIVVLVGIVGVLVLIPALLGNIVGRLLPQFGAALHRSSPILGLGVLAFALYATWSNVFMVLNLYVLSRFA